MEDTFKGFFYWWALRGTVLRVPGLRRLDTPGTSSTPGSHGTLAGLGWPLGFDGPPGRGSRPGDGA